MTVPTDPRGRRAFMASGLASGLALAALGGIPGLALAQARAIRIGYVSPRTGPLAAFGEADLFTVKAVRAALAKGLVVGGKAYPVEIIVKDSQSNPNRAASVAQELIDSDKVDLMLCAATPDTTNPVSDQCELAGVPCISTAAPWEAWYFGRGGTPQRGFDWTYHFFFGLDDGIRTYDGMWKTLPTNRTVGLLFPNDADGDAWANRQRGLPPALTRLGYKLVDPGRYAANTDNFSAHINAFKRAKVEIITGVMNPPDWTTFWGQARQQGFKPKIATIAKALVFPVAVENLGAAGDGLSSEVVWSRHHPFKSSLNGLSSSAYADSWEKETGKQTTPALGWIHALFEVAVDALRRSGNPHDKAAVRNAIAKTALPTILGPVNFGTGPVKNVSRVLLVGGQWKKGKQFKYDLDIVSNAAAAAIPTTGKLRAIP